jgi:nitrile hydratase
MSDDSTGPSRAADPKSRARAIQSLLIEKEMLSTEAVDRIISVYEDDIGPMTGKRVVARAWSDPEFKERLLDEGVTAMADVVDIDDETIDIQVVENTSDVHNVVVCTLCSCYPWAVLGLPPTWYKSPEYRSRAVREPREMLREEFGCEMSEDIQIEVWDSNSELRYMVLPQRPPGTDDLSEDELVELITRDSMIGVERLGEAAKPTP